MKQWKTWPYILNSIDWIMIERTAVALFNGHSSERKCDNNHLKQRFNQRNSVLVWRMKFALSGERKISLSTLHSPCFSNQNKPEKSSTRVSAVNSGRLRFGGQWAETSSKLKNRIITFNLQYFVFLFVTVNNFSQSHVIYVALLFRWVV